VVQYGGLPEGLSWLTSGYSPCAQAATGRDVDADTREPDGVDDPLAELIAPVLPVPGAALKPLGAHLNDDVETTCVVRTVRTEADVDVTGLKFPVVGLFRALDRERHRVRQHLEQSIKPLPLEA
jgi:hypothetical protein